MTRDTLTQCWCLRTYQITHNVNNTRERAKRTRIRTSSSSQRHELRYWDCRTSDSAGCSDSHRKGDWSVSQPRQGVHATFSRIILVLKNRTIKQLRLTPHLKFNSPVRVFPRTVEFANSLSGYSFKNSCISVFVSDGKRFLTS